MTTQILDRPTEASDERVRHLNPLALVGLVLGLLSIRYPALGITPVLGIVFSILGMVSFNEQSEKMRWMGSFGFGLSCLVAILAFH